MTDEERRAEQHLLVAKATLDDIIGRLDRIEAKLADIPRWKPFVDAEPRTNIFTRLFGSPA